MWTRVLRLAVSTEAASLEFLGGLRHRSRTCHVSSLHSHRGHCLRFAGSKLVPPSRPINPSLPPQASVTTITLLLSLSAHHGRSTRILRAYSTPQAVHGQHPDVLALRYAFNISLCSIRPSLTAGILVPAWGLTMAARAVALPLPIFAAKLAVFALGSFLLHSAACVLNDICDIEFDRQVGEQRNIELLDMTSAKSDDCSLFLCRAHSRQTTTGRRCVCPWCYDSMCLTARPGFRSPCLW